MSISKTQNKSILKLYYSMSYNYKIIVYYMNERQKNSRTFSKNIIYVCRFYFHTEKNIFINIELY